jgi:cytochrome P450
MLTMPLEHFGIDGSTPEAQFFTTMQSGMMLTMDAPDHTRLRRLALKAFTPRVVEHMRGEVRAIVDQLLDDAGSSFDVMQAVAAPLPAMVIARLLGIPEADWAQFKTWSDGLIGFNITREKVSNFARLGDYLREQIAQRRVEPRDDLISDLAVNELLRLDSPFQALSRRTIENVEMDGHQLAAGLTVWLWIAAANRDPSRFAVANALDFARKDNRHLSFGLGPHYCLGAALAQLEIGVALEAMRQRWPALHLEPGGVTWKADGAIRGPSSLAVAV